MQIRKAEKREAKLRLALCGIAGSGKTLGALKIAKGMGCKKIGLIDTERGSADIYSNVVEFGIINILAPFTIEKYINAITEFEVNDYDIVIIDSLSHAWDGEGGLLDKQQKITETSKSGNSYMAWRQITPEHNQLINKMLASPCHIIGTMRAKTEYVITEEGGRKIPKKVGLAPVQRDGMEYEFTTVFEIGDTHKAITTKDRTSLFANRIIDLAETIGKELSEWLLGKEVKEQKGKVPKPAHFGGDGEVEENSEDKKHREILLAVNINSVKELLEQTGSEEAKLLEYYNIKRLSELTKEQSDDAIFKLQKRLPLSSEQENNIRELVQANGVDTDKFKVKFGVSTPTKIRKGSYDEVIKYLEDFNNMTMNENSNQTVDQTSFS